MKEKIFNNKNRLIFLISSLILLIVLYIILIFINSKHYFAISPVVLVEILQGLSS